MRVRASDGGVRVAGVIATCGECWCNVLGGHARRRRFWAGRFVVLKCALARRRRRWLSRTKSWCIIYHLFSDGTFYDEERYAHVGPKQQERERNRAIKALERLGYNVTVEHVA